MDQPTFAELVGCSSPTLASIETLRTKLHPDLAAEISDATGISISWLLANNLKMPPLDSDGQGYSSERHEDFQKAKFEEQSNALILESQVQLLIAGLLAVTASSIKKKTFFKVFARLVAFTGALQTPDSKILFEKFSQHLSSGKLGNDLILMMAKKQSFEMVADPHLFKMVREFRLAAYGKDFSQFISTASQQKEK